MDLYISGTRHFAFDSDGEMNDIEEALNTEPDVIFTEQRDEESSNKEVFLNLIAAPLILITMILWSLLLLVLRKFSSSDKELRNDLLEYYDAERVKADSELQPFITDARGLWAVVNYLSLIPFVLFAVVGSINGPALTFLVIAVFIAFSSFVAATATARNVTMVMKIGSKMQEEGIESGVLVVGHKHRDPILRLLKEYYPSINIIE